MSSVKSGMINLPLLKVSQKGQADTIRLSQYGFPDGPNGQQGKYITNDSTTTIEWMNECMASSPPAAWQAYWGLNGFDPQFGGNKDMDSYNPGNLPASGIPGSDGAQTGGWVPGDEPPVKGPPVSAYMPLLRVPEDPTSFTIDDLGDAKIAIKKAAKDIAVKTSHENRLSPRKSIKHAHENSAYKKNIPSPGKYHLGKSAYTQAASEGILPEHAEEEE